MVRPIGARGTRVDLVDYPQPFFDDPAPAYTLLNYPRPEAATWDAKIDQADGYLIITPAYNHG